MKSLSDKKVFATTSSKGLIISLNPLDEIKKNPRKVEDLVIN
jgi:hypothetical protein